MSSILSTLANGYYQLTGQGNNTGAAKAATATPSLAQTLSGQSSGGSDAYLLDLSPQAQQYLSSVGSSAGTSLANTLGGVTGSNNVDPTKSDSSFVLTPRQQEELTAILTKYKDAPQTQATFEQIQNDLNAAGLSANQLSQLDQVKHFNSTEVLINALNGNFSDMSAQNGTTSDDEKTKSNNYMQQVIGEWQSIAGVAPAGGTGGT